MSKGTEFFKNLRVEYKVVLFFVVILIIYTLYSLLFGDMIKDRISSVSKPSAESRSVGRPVERERASSINEAVSSERPVIISSGGMREKLEGMSAGSREIKGMELATEVENPTVWIYVFSDGGRKDNLAKDYCQWLHDNGVPASSVTILDEAARAKGRLIEIGESKCM